MSLTQTPMNTTFSVLQQFNTIRQDFTDCVGVRNMLGAVLLLLTSLLVAGATQPQLGPLVHVEQGALRGTYLTSAGGRKFSAFQGIPYARPPTGKHRFKV
jgi:hypothetical protein